MASVTPQHRLIVIDYEMKEERKGRKKRASKIKWWRLKDEQLKAEFKNKVLDKMEETQDPNTWWTTNSKHIFGIGEEVFGKTSGKDPPQDKETWWWNNEVREKVKEKKEANI